MLKIKLLGVILFTFLLTACGPMYKTTYTYEPPKDSRGKMCVMQCQQSKGLCSRLCNSDYQNCKTRGMNEARFRYDEYVSKRRRKNEEIKRDLNYFYDATACAKQSCGCEDEYRSCYQLCGGKAIPHKTCVAFCG